jgi:small subunit ribosomal protein S9
MEITPTPTAEVKSKQPLIATGRRKKAVARVRVFPEGTGKFVVNGKECDKYFMTIDQKIQIKKPLVVAQVEGKFDIKANVFGGGQGGQAGAISLGIARCLLAWNPELKETLKQDSLLTRDPRSKERKKYGRKGARRRFQWTKR